MTTELITPTEYTDFFIDNLIESLAELETRDELYYMLLAFFEHIDAGGRFAWWNELVEGVEAGRVVPVV